MAVAKAASPALSLRAINRAYLARQMLLQRTKATAKEALERLLGMQAQVPQSPYFGLWSRLQDFDAAELSGMIERREAVRIAVMRSTVHLVTAHDALYLRPLVQPWLTRVMQSGSPFGKQIGGVDRDELVALGRSLVAEQPMTLADLRPYFAARWPGVDPTALSWVFHYLAPLVQVPPRALWRQGGLPRCTTLEVWLGREMDAAPEADTMVLRYLAGFGPASVLDAQAWSGLTKLKPVFERLRPRLLTFLDPSGRELFDLPDAPRPDEDTPAPPRLLPEYDNLTLAHADRSRVMSRTFPGRPIPTSVNVRAFLIDGIGAGFWKVEETKRKAVLLLEPFAPLAKADHDALFAEAHGMLAFAAPDADERDVRLGEVY